MTSSNTAGQPTAAARLPKRERTRRAIAEAAFRLFAERGFEAVRLAEVAAAADVAPATLYAHYATKEAVFFSRRDEFADGIAEAVEAADGITDLLGRLEEFFRRAIGRVLEAGVIEQSRTFARILLDSPALMQAYGALERERRVTLERALTPTDKATASTAGEAALFAALATAAANATLDVMHERLAVGDPAEAVRVAVDEVLERGFGRLAHAYEEADCLHTQ